MTTVSEALHFAKLHATGNDFLVVADLGAGGGARSTGVAGLTGDPVLVAALCDRATGVGADGLLVLRPGRDGADCSMELHNADGGIAEMSGNGIRCLVWVADRFGLGRGDRFVVDTGGGRRTVDVERAADGTVTWASVDMGPVTFEPDRIPVTAPDAFGLEFDVGGLRFTGDAAGMGNPHVVIVSVDVDAFALEHIGPMVEHDPRFPRRTNVEVIAARDRGAIDLRVWERGAGLTRSCGTGACAAAAVAQRRELVDAQVDVRVPGGTLRVEVGPTIVLAGPVVPVFEVDVEIDRLRASAGVPAPEEVTL